MNDAVDGSWNQHRPALIDTHCHLDDPAFDVDRDQVFAASVRAGVVGWINVGFHPDRWRTTVELSHSTRGMWHALGLHPQHAEVWSARVRDQLRSALTSSAAVALGEIGLDFARGTQTRDVQRRAFTEQLDLSVELGLGVIIHQRAAEDDVVDVLETLPAEHPVLLHSFDGKERLAALAKERTYLIGVGGLATRPRYDALRERLKTLPLAQTVVESDSPYLIPDGVSGTRNAPANIAVVARFLARLHGASIDDVAAATNASAVTFFNRELLANPVTSG